MCQRKRKTNIDYFSVPGGGRRRQVCSPLSVLTSVLVGRGEMQAGRDRVSSISFLSSSPGAHRKLLKTARDMQHRHTEHKASGLSVKGCLKVTREITGCVCAHADSHGRGAGQAVQICTEQEAARTPTCGVMSSLKRSLIVGQSFRQFKARLRWPGRGNRLLWV